jgi:hypothetical protein
MISIESAIILASPKDLLGFLWHEKYRMEMLEEENDDLWDNFSTMVDHIRQLEEEVRNIKNGDEAED